MKELQNENALKELGEAMISRTRAITFFLTILSFTSPSGPLTHAATQSCYPLPSGLVGWWTADGDASDIANNNDGTLQNGATYVAGIARKAFAFDDDDDFMLVPNSQVFNFGQSQDFTITAWINIRNSVTTHDDEIIVKIKHAPDGFSGGYAFRVSRNTRLVMLQLTPDGFTTFNIFSNTPIPSNTWTHVAAVRQGTTGMIYINGTLEASATLSDLSLENTWPLSIGGLYDTRFSPPVQKKHVFGGWLDEVAIFDRALAPMEIRAIFESGSSGKCKFRLPFIGGINVQCQFTASCYLITNGPGCGRGKFAHRGVDKEAIDFGLPLGTVILATEKGKIQYAGERGPYGKHIRIKHPDNSVSIYAHLSRISVEEGDTVQQADSIGESGATGNADGPHLHFQVNQVSGKRASIRNLPGIRWYSGDSNNPCQPSPLPDGEALGSIVR